MAAPDLPAKRRSLHALEASNFFLADVQTGLGPFVAAYLASNGWRPDSVGHALTIAGIATVALQTPAGAIVDRVRNRRWLLVVATVVLGIGALLLSTAKSHAAVYAAQGIIGACAPFLGPTLAAITLGMVGAALFDRQFGRNQGFNSAGTCSPQL
jgi:MFS family permease